MLILAFLTYPLHHRGRLLAVQFGINRGDGRRRVAEDGPGDIQAELLPEPGGTAMPQLVWVPAGNAGLPTGLGDRVAVRHRRVVRPDRPASSDLPLPGLLRRGHRGPAPPPSFSPVLLQ